MPSQRNANLYSGGNSMRLAIALVFMFGCLSAAEADFAYRGYIMTDLRLSLPGKDAPGGDDEMRFLRLDNSARLTSRFGADGVEAHADLLLTYRGFYDDLSLSEMDRRTHSDPHDFESDALYVHVSDVLIEGLDLIAGRQIVQWGAADQFNPTGVLNPLDLEDPIRFGDRIPNEMLLLRYTAPWSWSGRSITFFDELSMTLAALPTHRPTQLPSHSSAVFEDPALFAQLVNNQTVKDFTGIQQTIIGFDAEFEYESAEPRIRTLLRRGG